MWTVIAIIAFLGTILFEAIKDKLICIGIIILCSIMDWMRKNKKKRKED